MTDNKKDKQPITIIQEAEKEPKPKAPKTGSDSEKSPPPKGQKRATLAIIISILLAGSVIAFEAYNYKENTQTTNQLKLQLSQLSTKVSDNQLKNEGYANSSDVIAIQKRLETQIDQQDKTIKGLQEALADIKGRKPNDWLLSEADYLMKMAGRKLFLEHDIESATQLVISADQRIATLNDPSLIPLRKAMAEDITHLKSLPMIDREGLVLTLISLQKEVDNLPLANILLPLEETKKEQVVSDDINDWKDNLMTSLKNFSDHFITFRSRQGATTPLLSPEQHFYLRENIKAKLESAIKGVYSENNEVYQSSLDLAQQWSTEFFNSDSTQMQKFVEQLGALKSKDITVNYPVKLNAQKPLSDLISDRIRRSISSVDQGE